MVNNVVLVGRLTRDPEEAMAGEHKLAKFTLAVPRVKPDEADFIPVEVWGKGVDATLRLVTKGSLVSVTGRMRVDNYEGNDGQKKTFTKVVTSNVGFISLKERGDNNSEYDSLIPPRDNNPF